MDVSPLEERLCRQATTIARMLRDGCDAAKLECEVNDLTGLFETWRVIKGLPESGLWPEPDNHS